MKDYIDLFFIFMRIGAVNFGGGYAMLPLLTHEFVDGRHWATDDELADYFAIGQCTPGLIAINVATFMGNKKKGLLGGIVATLGFITVPMLLLTVIAAFLQNFAEYPMVRDAFAGIRVCVCVLILQAILRLWKKSIVDKMTLAMFLVILGLNIASVVSPVLLVIAAGLAGLLLYPMSAKGKGAKKS